MENICIILQGQLYKEIINDLLNTYKKINNNIILSTWTTEDKSCIEICRNQGWEIILQDPPEYKTAVNYMVKSLTPAIKLAIEKGYTHGFRFRTDQKINDVVKMLNILYKNCPKDKLCFESIIVNKPSSMCSPEYLIDQSTYGPLEKLQQYYSTYQLSNDSRFPELFLMETYFGKSVTFNDIKNEICLFRKIFYENNIIIEWTKPSRTGEGNLIIRHYLHNAQKDTIDEARELGLI